MLYTASYILNNTSKALEYPIHPFCHSLSNIGTAEGATRQILVPDVLPSESTNMDLSMAAGDFLEIYSDDEGVSACMIREQGFLKFENLLIFEFYHRAMGCVSHLLLHRHSA